MSRGRRALIFIVKNLHHRSFFKIDFFNYKHYKIKINP